MSKLFWTREMDPITPESEPKPTPKLKEPVFFSLTSTSTSRYPGFSSLGCCTVSFTSLKSCVWRIRVLESSSSVAS